jgi:hypothetical protein
MLIIYFDIKLIVHKKFVLAGQTFNSTYYSDVLWLLCESIEDFALMLRQKNWLLYQNNAPSHTSFFTREFSTKNMILVPNPLYFPLFPRLNIKLKVHHTDTTKVIETESQVMVNTFKEHNFQNAFKIWQNCREGSYARKGTSLRVMVASRPNVRF